MSGQGAGKCTVSPVLLKKGDTKLALYGLGYLRDARLYRMLRNEGEVTWNRPVEDESCWFNLFFIHQNRVARQQKNFVSEGMLPKWLDFVVWGHEHACKVEPQLSVEGGCNFMVSQPGSSCVVSLSEDEAIPKAVLQLDLKGPMYRAITVPLTTSRPFIFRNIALQDQEALKGRADDQEAVFAFLQRAVNEAIATAAGNNPAAAGPAQGTAQQHQRHAPNGEVDTRHLPLIRLRVDHSGGFPTVPLQRFGASFVQRVANPWDLLQFHKAAAKRGAGARRKAAAADDMGYAAGGGGGLDDDEPMEMPELDDFRRIDALVSEHLPADLAILAEPDMAAALEAFVQQDEKGAIEKAVSSALLESQKRVAAKGAAAEAGGDKELFKVINQSVAEIKTAKQQEREAKLKATAAKAGVKARGAGAAATADEPADKGGAAPLPMDEDDAPAPAPAPARGAKAPKQARGAAANEAPRPPRRAAAKKKAIVETSSEEDGMDDDDEEEDIRPVRKRARAPAAHDDDGASPWSDGEDDHDDEPTPPRGKGAAGSRGKTGAAAPRAGGRKPAAAPAKKGRKSAAGSVPVADAIEVVDLVDSGDDEPAAKAPRATAPAPGGTAVLPSQQPSLASIRGGWGSLRK